MTATHQTARAAERPVADEPVSMAAEITVDGIRLPAEFGIEVSEDHQGVWLTRGDQRLRKLAPTSRIVIEADDWSIECDGNGRGVYRGSRPRDEKGPPNRVSPEGL